MFVLPLALSDNSTSVIVVRLQPKSTDCMVYVERPAALLRQECAAVIARCMSRNNMGIHAF